MSFTVPGINTKDFINEVEKRRPIWDITSDFYTDKEKRKECWEELTLMFMDGDSATEIERERFGRNLQRRWKNIRDCYTRQLQKGKGSLRSPRGSYIYSKELKFLDTVVKPLHKLFKEGSQRKNITIKRENQTSSKPADQLLTTNGIGETRSFAGSDPLDIDDIPTHETDCDRMFLLSLLDSLKEIPEDYRFKVKMDFMRIIHEAKIKSRTLNDSHFSNIKEEILFEEESLDSMREPSTPELSTPSDNDMDAI